MDCLCPYRMKVPSRKATSARTRLYHEMTAKMSNALESKAVKSSFEDTVQSYTYHQSNLKTEDLFEAAEEHRQLLQTQQRQWR